MLNETYRGMLAHKSVIRETFMYGNQRAAQPDAIPNYSPFIHLFQKINHFIFFKKDLYIIIYCS